MRAIQRMALSATGRPDSWSQREAGSSLMEITLVLGAFGVLAMIAFPSLSRARAKVEVAAARRAFAAAQALARQVASQYGRLSTLHLDPQANRFWVTIDTSSIIGVEVVDTVQAAVDVGGRFAGVVVEGAPRRLCFDPRGLATARGDCDLPNATVVFRSGAVADTVTISRLGRLLKR